MDTIALIAHDKKKEVMLDFASHHKALLEKFHLVATHTTGTLLKEKLGLDPQIPTVLVMSGSMGHGAMSKTVKLLDKEFDEELEFTIVGAVEANSSLGLISNESPLGRALIGHKKNDNVKVDAPAGVITYKVLEISRK